MKASSKHIIATKSWTVPYRGEAELPPYMEIPGAAMTIDQARRRYCEGFVEIATGRETIPSARGPHRGPQPLRHPEEGAEGEAVCVVEGRMKPPRRLPDLADKPELHEREKKRRRWLYAPSGTKTHRYREFKRSTTEALRAGA